MSTLVLVRHGETAGMSSIRFYGATDIELSDLGRLQMTRAGEALRGEIFRAVVTSPLRRSREGLELVLPGHGLEPVVVEGFREIDFGDWEGLSKAEIAERHPEEHRRWLEKGLFDRFPGGESRLGFHARVREAAAVFRAIELPALAVLHKGVIRGVLAELLGVSPDSLAHHPIELGSIHRLNRNGRGWELADTNLTGHLGEARIENS